VLCILHEALEYYEEGADGLGVWDAYTDDVIKICQWGRMGHLDELRERVEGGPADRVFTPANSSRDSMGRPPSMKYRCVP
jgi:hypothetical protein